MTDKLTVLFVNYRPQPKAVILPMLNAALGMTLFKSSPHLQNSPIGQSETVPQPNPKHAHPFLGRAPGQD